MMRVAIGVLTSLLLCGTALADQPVLRSDILVQSDVVTLGDLIDGLGDKGNVSIFSAPRLGRSGTIQAVRILDAARENGVRDVVVGDLTQVTVRRAGRLISEETVSHSVTQALIGEYGLPPSITVKLDPTDGFYVEPQARVGLRVRSLDLDKASGRFTADVVSYGAVSGQSFKAAGILNDEVEVPIVTKELQRNTPLDVSDITMEKRSRRELADDTIYDPAVLAQMMVTRGFRKGEALRRDDITPTPLVARGDLVTLIVEIDGMTLSTRGKAMQGGTAGTVITVQNVQTKRALSGTITGPGKVLVSVNETAQLAVATP
jgi:flagellar basal body P-ring formation protein FlgA